MGHVLAVSWEIALRWQLPATRIILRDMDTAPIPADSTQADRFESAAEQQRRLAWEAEMIAEARAELDAGLYATSAEVKAWIDSIGTDHELPVPYSGR
jgi:predicted transcriptional regulator